MATKDDWLTLQEAATLLGVHPGTVRNWSDKGVLPVYRTRGGHRRFKRAEVELWASTSRGDDKIDPASIIQAALRSIRLRISEGKLADEPWYRSLDDDARTQYRESAQTLFQGLMHFVAAGGENGQAEAREIGYQYARRAQRSGMHAADAARAFMFFRDALLQSVIEVYQVANVPSGRAWGEVLRLVNAFTDLILIELLETFQPRPATPSGPARA
ncbi:MAG TPA: helix-turn-helix domain-containing protein [Anaerolineales bacterium]|nr:helix-turn-helix domain-containing protein [Anaerolineales bacterium]